MLYLNTKGTECQQLRSFRHESRYYRFYCGVGTLHNKNPPSFFSPLPHHPTPSHLGRDSQSFGIVPSLLKPTFRSPPGYIFRSVLWGGQSRQVNANRAREETARCPRKLRESDFNRVITDIDTSLCHVDACVVCRYTVSWVCVTKWVGLKKVRLFWDVGETWPVAAPGVASSHHVETALSAGRYWFAVSYVKVHLCRLAGFSCLGKYHFNCDWNMRFEIRHN